MIFDDDDKEEHFPKRYVTREEHERLYPNGAVFADCPGCGDWLVVPEGEPLVCADCTADAGTSGERR
jgi:exosome complex RNA-binding protein Csl4